MKKNEMIKIDKINLTQLKNSLIGEECYVVEIDGNKIQSEAKLLKMMTKKFKMPDNNGWDSFNDWITDLSWIDENLICLIIYNYTMLLKGDRNTKEYLMETLKEDILPFWEKDAVNIVAEEDMHAFNVYIID